MRHDNVHVMKFNVISSLPAECVHAYIRKIPYIATRLGGIILMVIKSTC